MSTLRPSSYYRADAGDPAAATHSASATLDRSVVSGGSTETLSRQLNRSRAVRVRQALFPDSGLDAQQYSLEAVARGLRKPSSVQQLAEPAQILLRAVANLINYQEDADVALHAASELARLLLSADALTCQRAASLTLQLAKKQACRLAFAVQADLVEALLVVIKSTQSADTLRYAVGALCHICQAEQGCVTVYRCQRVRAVPELLRLLSNPDDRTRCYALACLHHLLVAVDETKDEARMASGVQRLTDLLVASALPPMSPASPGAPGYDESDALRQEQKMLAVCVDCLQLLAFANQESKFVILRCGGPVQLVELARRGRYEKLLFSVARLLKVLSVDPENKSAILEAGGMSALGRHLKSNSERLAMNALWTLRNLSDKAYTIPEPLDQILLDLVDLLGSHDADCVTCAAGVLCNLTCRNRRNKYVVTSAGGAVALSRTLMTAQGREEIAEPLICALRHITHDHQQARAAADAVLSQGLARALGDLLRQGPSVGRPLHKAALGLCRNLALHPSGRSAMHSQAAPDSVAAAIAAAASDTDEDRLSLNGGSTTSATDGVRPEEVLEAALACLLALTGGGVGGVVDMPEDDADSGVIVGHTNAGVGDAAELRRQRDACVGAVRSRAGLPDLLTELASGRGFGGVSSAIAPLAAELHERLSAAAAGASSTSTSATLQRRQQQQQPQLSQSQQSLQFQLQPPPLQQRYPSSGSLSAGQAGVGVGAGLQFQLQASPAYRYDVERGGHATLPSAGVGLQFRQNQQQPYQDYQQNWYNTAKI